MRSMFPGYFRPTASEFEALWSNCTFIPDANILLNAYRYPPDAKQTLLSIFEQIRDRLWVPNQSVLEFIKRRHDAMVDQLRACNGLRDALEKVEVSLELFQPYKRRSPVNVSGFLERARAIIEQFATDLAAHEQQHPVISEDDPVLAIIEELLDGKIGQPYDLTKLQQIAKEGAERYSKEIPPGYKDHKKGGVDQYGDLILWYQVLDYADQHKKPIIFVTDDKKDDWWWKVGDTTIGPRPELIVECQARSGQGFYMYDAPRFVQFAQIYLKRNDSRTAIEEINDIARLDEDLVDDENLASLLEVDLEELPSSSPPSSLSPLAHRALSESLMGDSVVNRMAELSRNSITGSLAELSRNSINSHIARLSWDSPISRFLANQQKSVISEYLENERKRNEQIRKMLLQPIISRQDAVTRQVVADMFKAQQQEIDAIKSAMFGRTRNKPAKINDSQTAQPASESQENESLPDQTNLSSNSEEESDGESSEPDI